MLVAQGWEVVDVTHQSGTPPERSQISHRLTDSLRDHIDALGTRLSSFTARLVSGATLRRCCCTNSASGPATSTAANRPGQHGGARTRSRRPPHQP